MDIEFPTSPKGWTPLTMEQKKEKEELSKKRMERYVYRLPYHEKSESEKQWDLVRSLLRGPLPARANSKQ